MSVPLAWSASIVFSETVLTLSLPPCPASHNVARFDECVEGGESVMLDTLPVLNEMRSKHPKLFQTLTQVPVTFQRVQHKGYSQQWLPSYFHVKLFICILFKVKMPVTSR